MNDYVQRRMRSDYHGEVMIERGSSSFGPLFIRNISLNGVYLETAESIDDLSLCKLMIKLGGGSDIELQIDGEVVRHDKEGIAIKFVSMSPVTFDHLRKVVMYNSSSPEDFLQECKSKPGFK